MMRSRIFGPRKIMEIEGFPKGAPKALCSFLRILLWTCNGTHSHRRKKRYKLYICTGFYPAKCCVAATPRIRIFHLQDHLARSTEDDVVNDNEVKVGSVNWPCIPLFSAVFSVPNSIA
eukprot:GHVP01021276.1.p1 GENE.GHVP01021276.1~~GHVP01021276.1.p1  ORF type:complete len:118 (+),score=12.04 GHVP01021276.1:1133-1486(+)